MFRGAHAPHVRKAVDLAGRFGAHSGSRFSTVPCALQRKAMSKMRTLMLVVPIALFAGLVSACGSAQDPASQDDVAAPDATAATVATDAPADTAVPANTAASEPASDGSISRESFGEAWPLTVDSGVLACDGKDGVGSVTFTADGTTYGVNGTALGQGLPAIDPIWADNPSVPGLKMNIGPVLDAGLALCK